jgi:hypothetical protein
MDIRQLLAQGYQAADRFLPFDGLLDPMFAPPPRRQMPQDVGAMPNMQSRFAPQQPAPMPQQMPAPVQAPRRGGNDFGRTMMEFIDPSFNRRADERSAAMANQEQRAQLFKFAQSVITDPREWLVFQTDPEAWAKARSSGYEAYTLAAGGKRGQDGETVDYNRQFIETGPEIVGTNADGSLTTEYKRGPTPEEALQLQQATMPPRENGPDGIYERQPDGIWKKVAKYGAAPKVFAPRVARNGGFGGSGYSDVPAGAVVVGGQ